MEKKYAIEIKNVSKNFGDHLVIDNLSLNVEKNEFLTLLGPSGCGKTTLLRILGGFEELTEGKIIFEGEDISNLPPYERQINTVFQKYALFPHMNIYENIAFGLKIKGLDKKEIDEKIEKILKLVNLSGYEKRNVNSLSGGQQQRIAIARALVNEPKILLLDEPLGALDLKLRKEMQFELKNMQQQLGITFIFVTHDQEEALAMSDTIVVLNEGEIQQIGSPIDIYNEPTNEFVAKFIGESNMIEGIMKEDYNVEFLEQEFPCVDSGFEINEDVDVVIRPEDLEPTTKDQSQISGVVDSVSFKGVHYELRVEADNYTWKVHTTLYFEEGAEIYLKVSPYNIHVMKRWE